MNSFNDSCNINAVYICGVIKMESDLQKLKDKLDFLLIDMSLSSQEALCLSREIDNLIVEYYQKKNNNQ